MSEFTRSVLVNIEIELKIDWHGCKKDLNCQILHLIGQWS